MDIGIIHSIWTVVILVCFIGIVCWAYNKRQKPRFDEAANLIFDDNESSSKSSNSRS